jgi:hypothetical protein
MTSIFGGSVADSTRVAAEGRRRSFIRGDGSTSRWFSSWELTAILTDTLEELKLQLPG